MRGKTAVAIALAGVLGAIVGAFAQGDIIIVSAGVVSLTGLALAFMLNWYFIAPEAGRRAKENLMRSFAEPTDDDLALIQGATMHILGNMSQLAQHEQGKELIKPLFAVALDSIDDRWKAIRANVASQRERGVGNFSPSNMSQDDLIQDLKGKLVTEIGDPILDALGMEGESRKVAQAIFLSKFASVGGGGNSGHGASDTPSYIAGGR